MTVSDINAPLRAFPVIVFLLVSTTNGEEPESISDRPKYVIYRTPVPIRIDGKLDEDAWSSAPDFGPLQFTWWKNGKKEQTVAKMLWDNQYLYVGHRCSDAWITARCMEHDGPVARDDCFEVMIAPNPDEPTTYFNIEWNVLGAFVDGQRIRKIRREWDASDVRISGSYIGSLNDDSDTDKHWIVEVAIPFKNFNSVASHTPPRSGDRWNLNLNRHGGDTNLQYSQWSRADTPAPSFHTPHRFGHVIFSADTSIKRQSSVNNDESDQ